MLVAITSRTGKKVLVNTDNIFVAYEGLNSKKKPFVQLVSINGRHESVGVSMETFLDKMEKVIE